MDDLTTAGHVQSLTADVQLAIPIRTEDQWPLGVWLYAAVVRLPRGNCTRCGFRRILYAIRVNDTISGPRYCSWCSGIRR